MSDLVKIENQKLNEAIESALIQGDLSKLSTQDRVFYYRSVCRSLKLNYLTRPFDYIKDPRSGALTLFAKKACTDQLRKIHKISIGKPEKLFQDDLFIVTVTAQDALGRQDTDIGVVSLNGLSGSKKANALMICLTKAKRRVTLSICGLGVVDETELHTMPHEVVPLADMDLHEVHEIHESRAEILNSIKSTASEAGIIELLPKFILDNFNKSKSSELSDTELMQLREFVEMQIPQAM